MEYFIIGTGLIYLAKKKKLKFFNFNLQSFPKFRFIDKIIKTQRDIINFADNNHEKIKKLQETELFFDEKMMNKTKNHITRIFSLNSFDDANGIEMQTDADLYGGDTVSNISYNIKENSLIVEGFFEMKNKSMIEYGNMFTRVHLKNFPKKRFSDVNLIKICLNTNGHIVKFILNTFNFSENSSYQAHILAKSENFEIYELPLKNLMTNPLPRRATTYLSDSILLDSIEIEIESKIAGPYKIELKYINFEYDYDSEKFYQKYNLPIFLQI